MLARRVFRLLLPFGPVWFGSHFFSTRKLATVARCCSMMVLFCNAPPLSLFFSLFDACRIVFDEEKALVFGGAHAMGSPQVSN